MSTMKSTVGATSSAASGLPEIGRSVHLPASAEAATYAPGVAVTRRRRPGLAPHSASLSGWKFRDEPGGGRGGAYDNRGGSRKERVRDGGGERPGADRRTQAVRACCVQALSGDPAGESGRDGGVRHGPLLGARCTGARAPGDAVAAQLRASVRPPEQDRPGRCEGWKSDRRCGGGAYIRRATRKGPGVRGCLLPWYR